MQIFQEMLPYVGFLGFAVTTMGMLFMWRSSGAMQVSKDIINTYKTRVDQLEENEKISRERVHEHTKEIAKLQGVLEEKDKYINQMREILQNRNPELTEVLKEIRKFMESINGHMAEHTKFLSDKTITPAPQFVEDMKK